MYHFIIRFPDGEILTGETDTWEYVGMNDAKITFNGTVYVTSMSNVVIFYDEQKRKEALEQHDTRTTLGF